MRLTKRLLTSVCPVAVLAAPFAMGITPAFAQSTATQEIETVVVTGTKANISGGLFIQQEIAKTRSVINQDFIQTQIDGQSVVAQLNLLPGVSINNNDPYGASGGDIRLRGYPSNHISVELDGIPLNDANEQNLAILAFAQQWLCCLCVVLQLTPAEEILCGQTNAVVPGLLR